MQHTQKSDTNGLEVIRAQEKFTGGVDRPDLVFAPCQGLFVLKLKTLNRPWDGPWLDLGWTWAGPGLDLGWTWDGPDPGLDTYIYIDFV